MKAHQVAPVVHIKAANERERLVKNPVGQYIAVQK
jgi:hypothetical protein